MQYKVITVNLPGENSTTPADTARQIKRLRAENKILRRLALVCTTALLVSLALFGWQLHTTRRTYNILKASCELRAAAAEQRASDYRAQLDTYEAEQ